jgi:hypothetical protein
VGTASGDFHADGYADLAIGIPADDLGGRPNAGAVRVPYGGPRGLTRSRPAAAPGQPAGFPGRRGRRPFRATLEVGDFLCDRYLGLAIGVGGGRFTGTPRVGRVVVVRGSSSGLTAAGRQPWSASSPGTPASEGHRGGLSASARCSTQNSAGVDISEPGDASGEYLRVLTSRGASAWLAVGAPGEGICWIERAGSVSGARHHHGPGSGVEPAVASGHPGIKGGTEPPDSSGRM